MTAAALYASPAAQLQPPSRVPALVALARSYGPLRRCQPGQAPVLRLAAEHDRRVLPRWQRLGDSVHYWAPPGSYTRLERWQSRDHWLDVVVPAAINARPEALTGIQGQTPWSVSENTFLLYLRTLSLHAHQRTGRRCIVRPDRLAELMEVSKRTVQRCQKAAEALGLYVVITPGRMLTERESRDARECGSCQRGLSNEAALVVPAWLRRASKNTPSLLGPGGNVTPTRGGYRNLSKVPDSASFRPRSARTTEPTPSARRRREQADPPAAPSTVSQQPSGRVYDPAALALARDLVDTLSWLTGTAPGRLEPGLRRYVRCRLPWTAGDVVDAIDLVNQRLSRASMTRALVKNPPALLTSYLGGLDPDADHPRPWLDPDQPRPPRLSPTQVRNRQLLEEHRRRGPATPEGRDQALAAIRADLARRRADLPAPPGGQTAPPSDAPPPQDGSHAG